MRSNYDIQKLIDQVAELLQESGLEVDTAADVKRQRRGASDLLAGLGVSATLPPELALDLDGGLSYNRRIHGD